MITYTDILVPVSPEVEKHVHPEDLADYLFSQALLYVGQMAGAEVLPGPSYRHMGKWAGRWLVLYSYPVIIIQDQDVVGTSCD